MIEREFLLDLVNVISDLAHKVGEFEPEEITMDDVNKYYDEENRDLLYRSKENVERDKLARELAERILGHSGWVSSDVMDLAVKLKEKLDATTQ